RLVVLTLVFIALSGTRASNVRASPFARPAHGASAPARPAGDDFGADAKLLYRIGACGNDAPLAAELPKKAIARHCRKMTYRYARYRRAWVDKARPFIAA